MIYNYKKFLSFLLFAMVISTGVIGCGESKKEVDPPYTADQQSQIPPTEYITFSSLEHFLHTLRTIRTHGFASEAAEHLDLGSLDELYMPTGIPEEYKIISVMVDDVNVGFTYLHDDDLISENARWSAMGNRKHFGFTFSRDEDENAIASFLENFGYSEDDLIDGRYLLVNSNGLLWSYEGRFMQMHIPVQLANSERDDLTKYMAIDIFDIDDLG